MMRMIICKLQLMESFWIRLADVNLYHRKLYKDLRNNFCMKNGKHSTNNIYNIFKIIIFVIFNQEPKKTGPNFKITKGVSTELRLDGFSLELVWDLAVSRKLAAVTTFLLLYVGSYFPTRKVTDHIILLQPAIIFQKTNCRLKMTKDNSLWHLISLPSILSSSINFFHFLKRYKSRAILCEFVCEMLFFITIL